MLLSPHVGQSLFQKEAAVAGWIVLNGAEYGIPKPLIEPTCLEAEGVKPRPTAPTSDGLFLGIDH